MDSGQSLTFGTLLKRQRRAAGLTQEELAGRAELSVEAISALERGVSRAPHKDTVELLADALGLLGQDRAVFAAAARRRDDVPPSPVTGPLPAAPAGSASLPIGRQRELAALERHLAGKGPPVLLFVGEPGIGKSRLLAEAQWRGHAAGWSVLSGACYHQGAHEPYAPLLEALHARISGQSASHLRKDLQQCAWLVRLLPELADAGLLASSPSTLVAEQERRLMFGAVARYLANVAGPAGTLLVLDDLQWAGADALDLLSSLVRMPSEWSVRVVGAYRDTELTPQAPLAVALANLARAGLAAQNKLSPLPHDEARALLRGLLGGADDTSAALEEQILRRAGGVPFFLVSCTQGVQEGLIAGSEPDDVPWDVAETIRQRIAALPAAGRELVQAAAVYDRRVPRVILLAVAAQAGVDAAELPAALDVACQARLLAEVGEDAYEFAHNLSREVVWNDLGAARRAALHRRVAEALEREPGEAQAQALAYHYARCGEREKAADYLERAGDRAQAMCANTAAESCYRELVDRLDDLSHGGAAARAREKLGGVLRTCARYDEALEVLERAVRGYRAAADREGQWQAIAQIGRVHARRGTPEEGLARIQAQLSASGAADSSAPSAGLAALYVAQADLYYSTGRYHEQLAAAERAAALARALHDERLLTQAEQWRSTALLTMGRPEEALPALEEVIPAAEALGDLSSHLHALNQVALAYIQQGEFAKSGAYIARALATAEQHGDPVQVALMTYNRGLLGISIGQWQQARADFEQAATVMRQVTIAGTAAYPLLGLGHLGLLEGRWEAASRSLQEAIGLAERSGDLQALRYALVVLAERDLLESRPEVARARLERLSARRRVGMVHGEGADAQDAQILALLAWMRLELGDDAEAEELAVRSVTRARAEQHQLALVAALRVRGLLAMRRQAWQEAASILDDALSLSRAMPSSYDEARTLYLYGLLDTRRGAVPAAHTRLQEALDILHGLGERLYAEHVERALAELPSA